MWTQDNTEGFTQSECRAANAIIESTMARFDIDVSNINDALTNTYTAGIDAAAWEREVIRYFELNGLKPTVSR